MLSTNYIKQAFEDHFELSISMPRTKDKLVNRFGGQDVIQFDFQCNGITSSSHYNFSNMLRSFHNMAYLKIKDREAYSCFDAYRADLDSFTYKDKKLTRVLSEVLECCATMHDVGLYMLNREELTCRCLTDYDRAWFINDLPKNIASLMRQVGPLPRAYQDDPCSMTPAIFLAWFAEQHKKAAIERKQTYYIDFRPLASLIAGNGSGFSSCFGLPCFPHQEADCYNSSPSAYAFCPDTAILYSLSDDEKSLTGRAWIYFTPDKSIYFGRLYGDEMNKDICIEAAKTLGFNTDSPIFEPFSVHSIASGNAYLSDSLCIGFGPCTASHDKLQLRCTCLSCGDTYGIDTGGACLCGSCSESNVYCAHCNDYEINEDDAIYIEGIGYCCDNCARQCDDCGNGHLIEDMTDVGSHRYQYICESCLDDWTFVDCCDEWRRCDDAYYIESEDRTICSYCRREYYAECVECGELHSKDDLSTCSDCGSYVCSDCMTVCNHCEDTFCPSCMSCNPEHCLSCEAELEAQEEAAEDATE